MKLFRTTYGTYSVRFKTPKGWSILSTKTRNPVDARKVIGELGLAKIEFAARSEMVLGAVQMACLSRTSKTNLLSIYDQYLAWMNGINKRKGTISAAKSTILAWIKFANLESAKPTDIEDTHISPFINRDGFQKASTRNAQLAAIGSFFKWMLAKGYVSHNVSAIVSVDMTKLKHHQKEAVQRTWVSDEDFGKILKVIDENKEDDFWKHAARIGRATALRLSDVVNLEWANVSDKRVTVWMRKTEKRVSIPIPDGIAAILSEIEKTDDVYVFPNQRLGYDCLSMQFTRICKKAGVVGSFHSLRRAKLDEIVKSGGTLEDAREFAGHTSTKTTEGYIQL